MHVGERVLDWKPLNDGVRVRTDRAKYDADRLIIAAGAWDASLLPALRDLARPERQVPAWFEPSNPALFDPARFPVFNARVDEGRFYGFPAFGIPGFKLGKWHHRLESTEPDAMDREIHREDERTLREFAERYFSVRDAG